MLPTAHSVDLRNDVLQYLPPNARDLQVRKVNTLLVGPARSGKSSFINAVITALEDDADSDIHNRAPVGGSGSRTTSSTTTTRLERYDVASGVVLWDTWAWSDMLDAATEHRLDRALLDGRLPSRCALPQALERAGALEDAADEDDDDVDEARRMHCALVLLPAADTLDTGGVMARAARFVERARSRGVQCIVVITHCDTLDAAVAADPARADTSEACLTAAHSAAALLAVPLNAVCCVKLYSHESARVPAIDTLALRTLRAALRNAGEVLRRRYNQLYHESPARLVDVSLDSPAAPPELALLRGAAKPISRLRAWDDLLAPEHYAVPASLHELWPRARRNVRYFIANYLLFALVCFLVAAVYHIAQDWSLALGIAAVIAYYAVALRWHTRHWQLGPLTVGPRGKTRLFIALCALVTALVVRAFGRPLSFALVLLSSGVAATHSAFYRRDRSTHRELEEGMQQHPLRTLAGASLHQRSPHISQL